METIVNHWLLMGRMGSGKSTLASKMSPEYLVLDMDDRWVERQESVLGKYHLVHNDDVLKMVMEMERLRPGLKAQVGAVVVDSGTARLDYEQSLDRIKGTQNQNNKWQNDAFRWKADLMCVLTGAILMW
jgi:shikimate kinase